MEKISIQRVRETFKYDPDTGLITRIKQEGKANVGFEYASGVNLRIAGIDLRYNRVAWALHNGTWPPDGYVIDHINGIKTDNRIVNLRLATPTQNQQNKSGYGAYPKGVTWRDRILNPYQAKIRVNGKRIHLGSFSTMEEAAEAYREACVEHHGEFARYD